MTWHALRERLGNEECGMDCIIYSFVFSLVWTPLKERAYAVLRGGHSVARPCTCSDCLLFLPGPSPWISPSSLSLTALPLLSSHGQKLRTPGWSPSAEHHLLHPPHRSSRVLWELHNQLPPRGAAPVLWCSEGWKPPEFTFSLDDDPEHSSASAPRDCLWTRGPWARSWGWEHGAFLQPCDSRKHDQATLELGLTTCYLEGWCFTSIPMLSAIKYVSIYIHAPGLWRAKTAAKQFHLLQGFQLRASFSVSALQAVVWNTKGQSHGVEGAAEH